MSDAEVLPVDEVLVVAGQGFFRRKRDGMQQAVQSVPVLAQFLEPSYFDPSQGFTFGWAENSPARLATRSRTLSP